MEIWKPVVGIEGYEVSNLGNVRSLRRLIVLKPRLYGGYLTITVYLSAKRKHEMRALHRLVAEAFIPNPLNKPYVNHVNGIKTDNRAENLEWCTQAENTRHAVQMHLTPHGDKNGNAKLSNAQAELIRSIYVPYSKQFGVNALARRFNVSRKTISNITRGRTFKVANGTIHDSAAKKVPVDVRDKIRAFYQKGVAGRGLPSIVKKFGVSLKTAHNIVRE